MNGYRLVVSDLDGTLIADSHEVPGRNLEAIRRAREQGVFFVPATGRSYPSVEKLLEEIGTAGKNNEYVITLNGGVIVENAGHRILHMESLPDTDADELYRRGLEIGACIHVYTAGHVYGRNLGNLENEYMQRLMEIEEVRDDDLGFLQGEPVVKLLFGLEDEAVLKQFEKDIRAGIGRIETTYSGPDSLEVTKTGVTKGNALRILASRLGIPPEATAAVGDNFNDISMLKQAGLGAAAANAGPAVREAADIVTEADNNHGAVGEVLEKYVIREEGKKERR